MAKAKVVRVNLFSYDSSGSIDSNFSMQIADFMFYG